MKSVVKVRAPVRVDFGGGTTDIEPFYSRYGGAVLNCAISRYVVGEISAGDKVSLKYDADVPTSSGLGTSGAMTLVWLALITKEKDKRKLCQWVWNISQARELFDDGKQDQYAAAFGGMNFLEIDKKGFVKVSPIKIKKKVLRELEENLILVYSGKAHYSGDANGVMIRDLKKGKNVKDLLRIKGIAYEMRDALRDGDLDLFSELMNKETACRRRLARGVVPKSIEKMILDGMKNGAVAVKICGSGGGGSALFYGDGKRLRKFFGKRVIDFRIDFSGLQWSR